MAGVRFDTAVDRLRKIAEACSDVSRYRDDLCAAYAFGDILTGADVEVVQVALAVDLPPEELPWCTEPADLRGLAEVLRLDRAPVRWAWRPTGEPVANHAIVGPVRFWSRADGPDDEVFELLRARRLDDLPRESVEVEAVAQQLARDQQRALRHLRAVTDRYWEPSWRRAHKGSGVYPEDHLWRAVQGYLDLLEASDGGLTARTTVAPDR
jgi:hypothetical protein